MFRKYNKITNSYSQKYINSIPQDATYIVQEKIHGANFSIMVDGDKNVSFASRNKALDPTENFYGYLAIADELAQKARSVDLEGPYTVFGELFGGNYPHPDVEKQNIKSIQKGVFYSPGINFCAFDVYRFGNYLEVREANMLLARAGMLFSPTLLEGSLKQCLEFKNEYQTTIPDLLSLPPIENNLCEGNIIRPQTTLYTKKGNRVILKNKNERFSERKRPPKTVRPPDSEVLLQFKSVFLEFVTENRLESVLSKEGHVSQLDIGKVIKLMLQDVHESVAGETVLVVKSLGNSDQKALSGFLTRKIAPMVISRLKNET